MTTKSKTITGWVLTVILSLLFFGTAAGKFMVTGDNLKQAEAMGFSADGIKLLGVLEACCCILFIIPRTGVIGTLLLAAYMGGAIATHLEHAMPVLIPVIVSIVLWITAFIRFPELINRIMAKKP